MSYYPNNFYQNYQPQQYYNQPYLQPQPQGLQGKVVENQDMVKIAEIPFNSYGLFPKADLKEIYVKTWNNNGTTKIITYKPIEMEEKNDIDTTTLLLEKITSIENKLDNFTGQVKTPSPSVDPKKKEAIINGY